MDLPLTDAQPGETYLFFFVGDPRTLAVSPSASDFELRMAAWGSALRMASPEDPSWGCTRSRLAEIVALTGPDPEATLNEAMTGRD